MACTALVTVDVTHSGLRAIRSGQREVQATVINVHLASVPLRFEAGGRERKAALPTPVLRIGAPGLSDEVVLRWVPAYPSLAYTVPPFAGWGLWALRGLGAWLGCGLSLWWAVVRHRSFARR